MVHTAPRVNPEGKCGFGEIAKCQWGFILGKNVVILVSDLMMWVLSLYRGRGSGGTSGFPSQFGCERKIALKK